MMYEMDCLVNDPGCRFSSANDSKEDPSAPPPLLIETEYSNHSKRNRGHGNIKIVNGHHYQTQGRLSASSAMCN